jgi:hypothetical protein
LEYSFEEGKNTYLTPYTVFVAKKKEEVLLDKNKSMTLLVN